MPFRVLLAVGLALSLTLVAHADPMIIRGVNLGNALEAPVEGGWGVVLQSDYFPIIHRAGFDTVRVPILWNAHVGPAPGYIIDPAFFQRVDWVVAQAKANQLNAIIDTHYDDDLMKDPGAKWSDRFVTIWKQIAEHYQHEPDEVMFEPLNEPHFALTPDKWNALIVRTLAVIRPTNPTRTVVIGPAWWNGFDQLPTLQLPENDRHILVTFHYYVPLEFTSQGASWIPGAQAWLGTKWAGTDKQKAVIGHDFRAAFDWAKANHRPLFLGEFGTDHQGDMASRVRWTRYCARAAEKLGIGWTYWEFCTDDFGAYDRKAHAWRKPIFDALMPPESN
jgi:endoglucanase